MSTSVVLEGNIVEENGKSFWKGTWRFAKDKKGTLRFCYEKISNEVPADLLDYVSFLDPQSIAQALHQKQTDTGPSKHKRSRRGRPSRSKSRSRPKSIPVSTMIVNAADPSVQPIGSSNDQLEGQTMPLQESNEEVRPEQHQEAVKEQDDQDRENDEDGEDMEDEDDGGEEDSEDDDDEEHSVDVAYQPATPHTPTPNLDPMLSKNPEDASATPTPNPAASSSQPAIIPATHPLMGVWEGGFEVVQPKAEPGAEGAKPHEEVKETLFFHTLMGSPILPQFANLPPEPSFPYSLLKTFPPTGTSAATNANTNLNARHPASLDSAMGQPAPSLERLYRQVLIGFGRNSLGRFSLAALCSGSDENANATSSNDANTVGEVQVQPSSASITLTNTHLKCEKRYMSSKFVVKRGRRSHAEYALTYSLYPGQTHTASHAQANHEETGGGGIGTRVHRISHTNNFYAYLGGNKVTSTGALEASAMADGYGGDGVGERKRKRPSLGKPPSAASSGLSLSAQDLAVLLHDHPLALVGSRDPNQDGCVVSAHAGPATFYREAFLDVEKGEIYEGGWSNAGAAGGFRHGWGVCLFRDGLMYEGTWVRGKESGKGTLMTADRRVIYRGDWSDGAMHGVGEYRYGNGDVYVGDFKEGMRQGKGEYFVARYNCTYVGDWRENKRWGRGRFVWSERVGAGDTSNTNNTTSSASTAPAQLTGFYEGDWEGDMRSGRGYLHLSDGFEYDGQWAHNLMEGKGACTYPSPEGQNHAEDVQTYQGTYKSGLRDGRGSITFGSNQGAVYEGRFKEDRFEGQGTIKITGTMPGGEEGEVFIPIQIQPDFWRIHWKAGFGAGGGH